MGLWNLNKFPFQPDKLSDNLKNGALYKMLNSSLTKKIIQDYLKEDNRGITKLEEFIEKFSSDKRGILERIFKEKETIVPYVIFDHICKIFEIERDKLIQVMKNPKIKKTVLNIAETIVKFGVREPLIFGEPLMVVWNITNKCNLRCKHCYEDAGVLSKGFSAELTREEKIKVMEEITKMNIPTFAFAGGEPLMDPVFWELAKIGKEAGLYMSINTNGTLITKEVAERLKEIGFAYYGVSLDGASSYVHDEFRGVKGSFERALRGIKNLIEVGESDKVCISFTVAKGNAIIKNQIPEMIKLRDELGIRKVVLYNYIPCGRGDFNNDLTCEEREKLFELFYQDLSKGKEALLSTAPQFGRYCKQMYELGQGGFTVIGHFSSGDAKKLKNLVELIGGCGAGRAYISIQPDGSVTPCVFMPNVYIGSMKKDGEIRKENLIEIWEKSDVLNIIRDRLNHPEKHGCKGKYFSVCGGCVARSYAYFGDFAAPDPGCIFNKMKFENMDKQRVSVG
ncbi:MAG: radical SAM protein [Candidatus Omnitrophica bacterium]|nr:radical SAM protein [Candidatus Omnitrophota bacterium]MCM8803300.1 radical SAM protein [Candidatus Omnitrophota bacterium]